VFSLGAGGHGASHLHHVLLHGLGDFGVTRTPVEQCDFKVVVLGFTTGNNKDLVLGLVLLNHHVDHHLHLTFLIGGGHLVLHLALHVLHLLELDLCGGLKMLNSLLLVQGGLLGGVGLLELALLGGHHEFSEVGVLAHLHVLHGKFLLLNIEAGEYFLEDVTGGLVLQLDHVTDDSSVFVPIFSLVGFATQIGGFLALIGEQISGLGTDKLQKFEEVLIIDLALGIVGNSRQGLLLQLVIDFGSGDLGHDLLFTFSTITFAAPLNETVNDGSANQCDTSTNSVHDILLVVSRHC